jgi:hypothetical protein
MKIMVQKANLITHSIESLVLPRQAAVEQELASCHSWCSQPKKLYVYVRAHLFSIPPMPRKDKVGNLPKSISLVLT